MRLTYSLKSFLVQTAVWTGGCLAAELFCRFILHWGFPYTYPFVPFGAIFCDFHDYCSKFFLFHSRAFYGYGAILTYPAPTVAVFKIFLPYSTLQQHYRVATLSFIAFLVLSSLVMLGFFYRALVARGLSRRSAALYCGGVYLLSFPMWFEFHQGNIEVIVWIILSIGIWAHWTSRSWLASVCFGTAAAMKLFPAILLGLLLAKKQYRQLALALVVAGAVTLAGLWLVCPDIAFSWHQTNAAILFMRDNQMLTPARSNFNHTLWTLLRTFLPPTISPAHLGRLLKIYMASAAIAGGALYFLRIVRLTVVNQILCLSIASILFPPISHDYTLIHLYAPFALITFVALQQGDRPSRAFQVALALFAFVLSFQQEFIVHGTRLGGVMRAVALLALFILSVTCPFELEPRTDESLPASQSPMAI